MDRVKMVRPETRTQLTSVLILVWANFVQLDFDHTMLTPVYINGLRQDGTARDPYQVDPSPYKWNVSIWYSLILVIPC